MRRGDVARRMRDRAARTAQSGRWLLWLLYLQLVQIAMSGVALILDGLIVLLLQLLRRGRQRLGKSSERYEARQNKTNGECAGFLHHHAITDGVPRGSVKERTLSRQCHGAFPVDFGPQRKRPHPQKFPPRVAYSRRIRL